MSYTIDESLSDNEYTAAAYVAGTFGRPRTIESITIHHWGSFGQTHDGVVDFFVNRNEATSAHFVVSDGRINCLVSPENSAWAAGNSYGNASTIAIECHPEATPGDYATVAWLVAWLRDNYGANLPLYPHSHWTPTACPGIWDLARLDRLARGVTLSPAGTATPTKQELFTMGQYESLMSQIGLAHQKENNIAALLNESVKADAANAKLNQAFHAQTHAKVNSIKEVVDQVAAGQGLSIDWDRVEAAAKAGAAEALQENVVTVDVNVTGKEA